jgi:hypothetical protein
MVPEEGLEDRHADCESFLHQLRLHLTELSVRAFKSKPARQFKSWDTSTPDFGVLGSERSKSWIVMRGTSCAQGRVIHGSA